MSDDLRRLARVLGLPDMDEDLLGQALTHRSAGVVNNERLEFLGDALLGLIVAETLWERFPGADEHILTRMRASLVREETLARLARGLSLGAYLRLGSGELRSGGHARDSILADAMEALLAAVYLDQGFEGARTLVLSLLQEPLAQLRPERIVKDPKTRLQELLQSRHRTLPDYEVIEVAGTQHAQVFRVRCSLADDGGVAIGQGTSRRRAEQQAAALLLKALDDQPHAQP